MKPDEMKQLVSLINTFEVEEDVVGDAVDLPIIEGELVEEEKSFIDEAKTKKMFRGNTPEGFDWNEADVVRSPATGDRVFLKYGNEKRWIPDLETLTAIGWDLGMVKGITDDEMKELKEGYGILASRLW